MIEDIVAIAFLAWYLVGVIGAIWREFEFSRDLDALYGQGDKPNGGDLLFCLLWGILGPLVLPRTRAHRRVRRELGLR